MSDFGMPSVLKSKPASAKPEPFSTKRVLEARTSTTVVGLSVPVQSSTTLAVFSLGMFAWGAQNILARGFYAARDTLTPAIVGTVLTFLNLPLYWLLVRHYQHLGLAMASSIGI